MDIFKLCDSIIAAKKAAVKLKVEGDFLKFSEKVLKAELRDAESEFKEALRQILRTEGNDRFAATLDECNAYMQRFESETKDIEISYFRNVLEKTPTTVFLSKFLFSKKHKENIEKLRETADVQEKADKKKNMPCATISGTFSTRNIAGCLTYNGLAVMDFDDKDNNNFTAEQMKEILSKVDEVYYAGVSIGGKGVYAIIKTDNLKVEKHSAVIEAIGDTLKLLGLNYDTSGKDVSRLRFVSYDPSPYFNPNAYIFKTAQHLQSKQKPVYNKQNNYIPNTDNTTTQVEKAICELESRLIDITANYDDWVNIGFALASQFGTGGEDYYLRVSQYHPKFDPSKVMKKYQNFVKEGKSIKIGTFFKIIKEHGISIN